MNNLLLITTIIFSINSFSQTEVCKDQYFVKIDIVDIETGDYIDEFDVTIVNHGDTVCFHKDSNYAQDCLLLKLDDNSDGRITILISTKENGEIAEYSFETGYDFLVEIEVILYPKKFKNRLRKDYLKYQSRKFKKFKKMKIFEKFIFPYGVNKLLFIKEK